MTCIFDKFISNVYIKNYNNVIFVEALDNINMTNFNYDFDTKKLMIEHGEKIGKEFCENNKELVIKILLEDMIQQLI